MQPRRPSAVLAAALLLASPYASRAQETDTAVVIGHRYTLQSSILGEARPILIGLPHGYAQAHDRYPTLYVLDGTEETFHWVTGTVRDLSSLGRMPPLIVVAIPSTRRNRDLTPPTSHPNPGLPPDVGGADRFRSFLKNELIPWVDGRFRTTPYRTLMGDSFGGLFVVHTLHTDPDLFDAYLAMSPSLWWNDETPVDTLTRFLERPDLPPKHLVLTLANEPEMMRRPMERLTAFLRRKAPPGFAWEYLEIPDETHDTSELQATYRGLRAIFSDWAISDEVLDAGIPGLERHYRDRAAKYGVSSEIPPSGLFAFGYRLLGRNDAAGAMEAFRRAASEDPTYPEAFAGIAEADEKLGHLDEAVQQMQTAVTLAQSAHDPLVGFLRDELDRLKARGGEVPSGSTP